MSINPLGLLLSKNSEMPLNFLYPLGPRTDMLGDAFLAGIKFWHKLTFSHLDYASMRSFC